MKRILTIMLSALLLMLLAACGTSSQSGANGVQSVSEGQKESAESAETKEAGSAQETGTVTEAPASNIAEPEGEAPTPASHADILVAYFSATGTTRGVAEKIAAVAGGDLYEITAAEPYTAADLNYNDSSSRSTKEQNDKSARPEIGSEDLSLEGYTTLYLGFPIWWGEEPRILDTFVETYSFDGITVIPFCTSGGSGIGRSGPNIEALAGSGTWLEGRRFSAGVSESDLQSWIDGLQ